MLSRWKKQLRVWGRHNEKAYIRFYPNFGFRLGRVHFCRERGWHRETR